MDAFAGVDFLQKMPNLAIIIPIVAVLTQVNDFFFNGAHQAFGIALSSGLPTSAMLMATWWERSHRDEPDAFTAQKRGRGLQVHYPFFGGVEP